jgi:hypothetical protein
MTVIRVWRTGADPPKEQQPFLAPITTSFVVVVGACWMSRPSLLSNCETDTIYMYIYVYIYIYIYVYIYIYMYPSDDTDI